MEDMMRRALPIALLQMMLIGIVTVFCLQSVLQGNLLVHSHAQVRVSRRNISGRNKLGQYDYYTLKQSDGFVLARAPRGADGQPLDPPVPVAHFTDGFGLLESDNVLSMQLSPDGLFLAIDGTRDHGEQMWMYDTQHGTISLTPPYVMGNFLHWLPGVTSHMFLYRPMFPLGPSAPMDGGGWNPGLWEVDAATGTHKNIDIGVPSAFLIDAAPSPDGKRIIYATTLGLGMGSDTWLMNIDGGSSPSAKLAERVSIPRGSRTHLFGMPGGAQSIAGLFAWSPDGTTVAYERLSDSPTPFLPAGLWVVDDHGGQQRRLADADGGHGYIPIWSPDGHKIVFVERTNVGDQRADTNVQSLQSAIAVVDVTSGRAWVLASPTQTGMLINANPVWAPDGNSVTFTAFNPINRVLGGMPRYWSVRVIGPNVQSAVVPLTSTLTGVVAVG